MSEADLLDEMLEFGVSLDAALLVLEPLLRLVNDERGFSRALLEDAPAVAELAGCMVRQ